VWLNTGHPDHVQGLWVEDAAWDLPAGAAFVDAQGRDTGVRFIDLNGDGAPDLLRAVEVSGGATQTEAWLNLGAAPDRLETVTTPLGGELTFEYGSKVEYGAAQPLPVHVVTDIRADDADGTGPEARTEFFYDGGFFDPVDQEFRGFATVTAHRWVEDDQGTPVVDRETVTTYHQDPERAGLPERTEVRDGVGGPLLLATEVTYTPDLDGPPYISLPSETRRFEYDGNASARETKRTFTYDFELPAEPAYGNLRETVHHGDLLDASDDRKTEIRYTDPNDASGAYLVERVTERITYDHVGGELAKTQLFYDGSTTLGAMPSVGNLTRRTELLDVASPDPALDPTTTFEYDVYGNLTGIDDPRANDGDAEGGRHTRIEYDATYHTFPFRITLDTLTFVNHVLELQYTNSGCPDPHPAGAGLVHVEQGPNEGHWERCYDRFGRTTSEDFVVPGGTPALLASADWAYTDTPGAFQVTETRATGAGQRQSTSILDGLGRVRTQSTDAPDSQGGLILQDFSYDAAGRLADQSDPYFEAETPRLTTFEYDALDRTLKRTLPGAGGARTRQWSYDQGTVTITDPAGVQELHIDEHGDVRQVREFLDGTPIITDYDYDARGLLTGVTDDSMNQTVVEYDALGRRKSLDDPDAGLSSFEYDTNGNLKTLTNPIGAVHWTYDALDRPRARDLGNVTWQYDSDPNGIGHLAVQFNAEGSYNPNAYDGLGRVLKETYKHGTKTHALHTAYDLSGQVASRTYPTGRTVGWVRDSRGYLQAIDSGGDPPYVTGIVQDASGRVTEWTGGNGITQTMGYDAGTGRLASLQIGSLVDYQYGFHPSDQLATIDDQDAQGVDWSFVYDELRRLEQATGPFGTGQTQETLHYQYNAIGNLTCLAATSPPGPDCPGGTALTYPSPGAPRPHAPLTKGTEAITYDGAGNLKSLGTSRTYDYDTLGQLTKITEGTTVPASSATRRGDGSSD